MEGITILQTVVEKHATWGFSWMGLFCVIAAVAVFALCALLEMKVLLLCLEHLEP